jgi:hypothetical protein
MDSPAVFGTLWPHLRQTIMPSLGIIMLLHWGQNSIGTKLITRHIKVCQYKID